LFVFSETDLLLVEFLLELLAIFFEGFLLFEFLYSLLLAFFCVVEFLVEIIDFIRETIELSFDILELAVEILRFEALDVIFEGFELRRSVTSDAIDANPDVVHPFAILLQFSELEELVDHVLACCRIGSDELIDVSLSNVCTVEERVGVHSEDGFDFGVNLFNSFFGSSGRFEFGFMGDAVTVRVVPERAFEAILVIAVNEPELDGGFSFAFFDESVEILVVGQCIRAIKREEAGFKQR
jgi:hypothetical protein